MSENVTMRVLHKMEDFATIVDLQVKIWGMEVKNTVSPPIMNVISHNGGSIIAAEIDEKMVGFCLALASKRGNQILLWSHMAGVIPQYQGRKIGYMLKQEQREWAIANGYHTICWTFDPLQRGNANFNFKYLGTIADTYHVNHYGEMTDAINAGMASDRLEACWHLHDEHVVSLAEGTPPAENTETFSDDMFLVRLEDKTLIEQLPATLTRKAYCIEIPYDIAQLKKTDKPKAIGWQVAVRETMLSVLKAGYTARDFVMRDGRCWYVLRK